MSVKKNNMEPGVPVKKHYMEHGVPGHYRPAQPIQVDCMSNLCSLCVTYKYEISRFILVYTTISFKGSVCEKRKGVLIKPIPPFIFANTPFNNAEIKEEFNIENI